MAYALLKLTHILGAILIGAGLIGVWLSDLRSRQLHDIATFAEAVRYITVFYDGVVVPGALLLLGSGTWLFVTVYGGWGFLKIPWLAGMVALFLFEFIEGNTVTRLCEQQLLPLLRRLGDPQDPKSDAPTQVLLALMDESGYPHAGRLDSWDPQIDPETGTLLLRAVFPNPDGILVPGAFVRLRIPLESREALVVPEVAVAADQIGPYV